MSIVTVGIDTAKNVFAVHAVEALGSVQLRRPRVPRAKLDALAVALPPCTGAHFRARQFRAHGHTARLLTSVPVTPYRMSSKRGSNDAADAETRHGQS